MNYLLVKYNLLLSLEKLNSKGLYLIQLTPDFCKTTSKIYYEKPLNDFLLHRNYIYVLQHIVTCDLYGRYFYYKNLNNVLYLNEKLLISGIYETYQCSFCHENSETIGYVFSHCFVAKA